MSAIYLLRHGQASFGASNYDQLSALGFEQASALGAALRTRLPAPDVVVCGSMQRHRQTAETCLAEMSLPASWTEDAGFNEYDHRQIVDRYMDLKAFGAALKAAPDRAQAFEAMFQQGMQRWQNGAHDPDYDESWPAFRARCLDALERLAARLESGQNALVFTSGGTITVLVQHLLEFPLSRFAAVNWRIANASVSKIVCTGGTHFLSTFNEHAHFEHSQRHLLSYR